MKGYYIKRTNISADGDVTIIGQRLLCGANAVPYETTSSAQSGLKRQQKQDDEYCPDCMIMYDIVKADSV